MARFFQQASLPMAMWAVEITGIGGAALHQIRAIAGKATQTRAGGRSLDLDRHQAAGQLDPAYVAHKRPIAAWAAAVWESKVPTGILGLAARRAMAKVQAATPASIWRQVAGPAAATAASMQRIGW